MSHDIYKFDKSSEERLREYLLIFSNNKSSQIINAWSNYLELMVKPTSWTALWNISRKFCHKLQIYFPNIVIVEIEFVNFRNLTADVTITGVEDDEPNNFQTEVNDVPLKDLYVTKKQETLDHDFSVTAECLDQLRVFYHHLWWPWDDDVETEESWFSAHLEYRLQLYYDKLQGNLHYVSAKTVKKLIDKGREIYAEIEDADELLDTNTNEKLIHVTDCYNELTVIKNKLKKWEIPELRKILDAHIRESNDHPGVHFVIQECNIKEASDYISQALELVSSTDRLKCIVNHLDESLLNYSLNDTIVVTPGKHILTQKEYFDFNVKVKGLNSTKTLIFQNQSYECFFEMLAECVKIQNLDFVLEKSRTIIMIKRGTTYMNSILLQNKNEKTSTAVYVYENAKLVASNCYFVGFDVAIVCHKRSTVQLDSCIFKNNNVCIETVQSAQLSLNNCDLTDANRIPFRCIGYETGDEKYKPLDYLYHSLTNMNLNLVQVNDELRAAEFV